ncbi:transposase [Salmonella sp. 741265052_HSA]
MCKARLTEHQNITIIKLVEAGRAVKDICQEADISEVTDDIYRH